MLVLFLSTTMQFIIDFVFVISAVEGLLLQSDIALPDRAQAFSQRHDNAFQIVELWPLPVNLIISDFIVIWRAWVLVPNAQIPMAVVASANAVLNLYSTALPTKHAAIVITDPTIDIKILSASGFLSFGTNVLGTVLIAWKGWQHHQLMSSISSKRSQVSNILIILVEGGFAFGIIQLTYSLMRIVDVNITMSPLDPAVNILGEALTYLAAIFPMATTIIVRSQRSVIDHSLCAIEHSRHEPAKIKISTIRFAAPCETNQTQADSRSYDSGISTENGDISAIEALSNSKTV
ncbi:hypothetical protein C8J56DRAFT_1070135 [Mycena floridula]|nr:hypothetical protein C8J56DRAFT_1070135 [Mycena floridula]